MSEEKTQCGNCKYFNDHGEGIKKRCLRYPPVFEGNFSGCDWPRVQEYEWCGEHEFNYPKQKIKAIDYP